MALLVHLPLLGNFNNQGLADISSITLVSGNSFVTGGKIGSQSLAITKQQPILSRSSCMSNKKQMSYAFWIKVNNAWEADWLDGIRWVSTDGSAIYTSRQEFYSNCTRIGTWFKGDALSGYSFVVGEWTHLAGTYDYDTGIACFYINGVLQGTKSTLDTTHYCRGDFYIGDNNVDVTMNDVRIYDSVLSPMEVKHLSQGLILHYPLDGNNGTLASPNIMPNSVTMALGSANASTGTWRLAGSSNMTKTRVAITDSPIGSCYGFQNEGIQTANDGSCYGIDNFPFEADTEYTISMWARIVSGTEGYAGYNIYNIIYGTGSHSKVDKNYRVTTLPSDGSWVRCWLNFTINSTANRNIYIGITTGDTDVTTQMCGIKIEKGNKVSPWSPCPRDSIYTALGYDDGIEYDISGYGNNGIKNNSPTYSIDSLRYLASTHLDGVNQTIQLPNLLTLISDSIFTFNIWFKRLESEPSSKAWETIFGGPSGFELETCSANNVHDNKIKAYSWGSGSFEFEFDKWNMLTMVSNGTNTLFYLNGELKLTGTYKSLVSGTYFIGSWKNTSSQNYKGYVSDVRIYATALSAEDIQKLYTVSASIDSNGNAYSAAYVEG